MNTNLSLPVTFRGTSALTITDENARSRVSFSRFSPSSMKSINSCPARLVIHRLNSLVPAPIGTETNRAVEGPNQLSKACPLDPAPLGNTAHWVFKQLYQLPNKKRTEKRALGFISEYFDSNRKVLEPIEDEWRKAITPKVTGLFEITDPKDAIVVATEQSVRDVSIRGVPFSGIIDLVLKDGDGNFILTDFKTGKSKSAWAIKNFGDDDGDQLRIYAAVYREKHGPLPAGASLLYTGDKTERTIKTTNASVARATRRFSSAYQAATSYVEANAFPTRVSGLCGFCPLVNACPAAQEAGKDDRIGAPREKDLAIPILSPLDEVPALAENRAPKTYDPSDDLALMTDPFQAVHELRTHTRIGGETVQEDNMPYLYPSREAKAWEETTPRGDFNPASYAAIGVFAIASWATELADEQFDKLTASTVEAVACALHDVVKDAQIQLSGTYDLQSGLNTRLRGTLHTVLKQLPIPIGSNDPQDFADWHQQAVRRCVSIATLAHKLFHQDFDEPSWQGLVGLR